MSAPEQQPPVLDTTDKKTPCQQWLRAKCRRGDACQYYHEPKTIADLQPGQCAHIIGCWKRCGSKAFGADGFCSDHTALHQEVKKADVDGEGGEDAVDDGAAVDGPKRATKRVSAKARMLNPMSVRVAPDPISATQFADPTKPLLIDIGCARGKMLHTLAQKEKLSGEYKYNYVGFELREALTVASNEAAIGAKIADRLFFIPGDATANMARCLKPLLTNHGASVAWISILFPDPWTTKKHMKRRVVSAEFVTMLEDLLSAGRSAASTANAPGAKRARSESDNVTTPSSSSSPRPPTQLYICSDRKDIVCDFYDDFDQSGFWIPKVELTKGGLANQPRDTEASDEEDEAEEDAGKEVASKADVDRRTHKLRAWVPDLPFGVGTERDAVAERDHRRVHRVVLCHKE